MIARNRIGKPPPTFDPPTLNDHDSQIQIDLAVLDLLDRTGLVAESEFHLEFLLSDSLGGEKSLDLAEGLIKTGRMTEAIRLGWRAAGELTLNHPRVIRVIFPWPHRALIESEAREQGIDPYLVAATIRQESAFLEDATSRVGARGMMQLMPATAREIARRQRVRWSSSLLVTADANVHLGTVHLGGLLNQYEGNLIFALAAYNGGGGNLSRWRRRYRSLLDDPVRFLEAIPFPETRGYVKTVLRNYDIYRALYPPNPGA